MSNRDKLRSAVLSTPEFRKEIVEHDGLKFEVRQPTNSARKELYQKATDEAGRVDVMEMLTWGAIFNTFDPETGERVFEDTDYDTLMNMPAGGIMDELGNAAASVMNVEEDQEKKSGK